MFNTEAEVLQELLKKSHDFVRKSLCEGTLRPKFNLGLLECALILFTTMQFELKLI